MHVSIRKSSQLQIMIEIVPRGFIGYVQTSGVESKLKATKTN